MAAETSAQDPTAFEQVTVSFTEEKEFILDPYLFALSGCNLHQYCTMLSRLEQQNPKPEMFLETPQGISVQLTLVRVVEEFEVLPYSYQEDRATCTKSYEPSLPGSNTTLMPLQSKFMPKQGERPLRIKTPNCSEASKLQQDVETKSTEIVSPEENLRACPELLKPDRDRGGQAGEFNATILQQEGSHQPPATDFIVTEQSNKMAPEGPEQSTTQEEGRSVLLPGDNSRRGSYGSDRHIGEVFLHTGDRNHSSNNLWEGFSEQPLSLSIHKGVVTCACPACGKIFSLNCNPRFSCDPKSFICLECGHSIRGATAGLLRDQGIPANQWDRQLHPRQNPKDRVALPFKCPDCGRGFEHKSSIPRHQKLHHKENASSISEPPQSFSRGPKHFTHEKTYAGQKSFQCHKLGPVWVNGSAKKPGNQCDPHASTLSGASRDISLQPPELQADLACTKKPFGCSECGKRFTAKDSMLRHQLLHQAVRPFRCPCCDKSYIQKNHLKRHGQAKHGWDPKWRESL